MIPQGIVGLCLVCARAVGRRVRGLWAHYLFWLENLEACKLTNGYRIGARRVRDRLSKETEISVAKDIKRKTDA